jgi:hypothetical protein
VGSGEKLIKEEAENMCARPHSGIRLSVIDKVDAGVDNDSMKRDDDNERNKTDNETANGNKEMSIGCSGFSLHSPGYNCKGSIVLNVHNNNICEGVDKSTGAGGIFGSQPVYPISVNHACMLTNMVVCPVSFVHTWEREAQLILKIIVEVQGADLRRFDKHKKRATLGMGEYPPAMNYTLFCCTQGIEVWMGKYPLPSCAVHKWS